MSQAIFYPWIDIQDEAWLKTSLLYWDSIRTIVPTSVDSPYSTDSGRALQDAGFLVPLRVNSGMEEIEELADDALTYLTTSEGAELLVGGNDWRRHDIHIEKLPYRLRRLADMHPEKLPHEIRSLFSMSSNRGSEWIQVDDGFALFYMTLLATRLADRVGASLLTPLPAAERLAIAARLDSQLNGIVPWGIHGPWHRWREYEAFGPRRRMPRHLAPGLLAQLAIQRIAIDPETPIDRLLTFREQHKDELSIFRTKIEQLTAAVEADLSLEALRQRILDLHANEVEPALADLKNALHGRKIRWLGDGLLKVAFLSAGSSTMLVAAGLAVPTALLAGAGLSLIVSGTMYNVDRRESLRGNPFAYLLSMERELA
jgi:hypothetical protein